MTQIEHYGTTLTMEWYDKYVAIAKKILDGQLL